MNYPVLLLDQSYQSIATIGWQKAIVLISLDKAQVIEEYRDKQLRSPSITINMPAVIKLTKSFKRPKRQVKFCKQNLLFRDNWSCCYCGSELCSATLTYDHVMPKSKGGKSTWDNIVSCCSKCNIRKGNKTLRESGLKLSVRPYKPTWLPIFTVAPHKEIPEEWKGYIK